MIDCHVHAAPSLEWLARRWDSRLGEVVGRIPGVGGRAPATATKAPVTVRKLAAWRRKYPRKVLNAAERVSSISGLGLLATGGATTESLLASMDRCGIEKSVLIAGAPLAPNDWLLEDVCSELGDRVIPVAWIPDLPLDTSDVDLWERGFEDLAQRGARGFKFHPNSLGIGAGHPALEALFAVAQRRNLFVILHTGCFHVFSYKTTAHRAAHPLEFESYFERYRDVHVCLAHMNRDEPEAAWDVMQRHEQVWTDTSWQDEEAIRACADRQGTGRLLLGSDWPLLHSDLQAESISILRQALGDERADTVATSNALEFTRDAGTTSGAKHEHG